MDGDGSAQRSEETRRAEGEGPRLGGPLPSAVGDTTSPAKAPEPLALVGTRPGQPWRRFATRRTVAIAVVVVVAVIVVSRALGIGTALPPNAGRVLFGSAPGPGGCAVLNPGDTFTVGEAVYVAAVFKDSLDSGQTFTATVTHDGTVVLHDDETWTGSSRQCWAPTDPITAKFEAGNYTFSVNHQGTVEASGTLTLVADAAIGTTGPPTAAATISTTPQPTAAPIPTPGPSACSPAPATSISNTWQLGIGNSATYDYRIPSTWHNAFTGQVEAGKLLDSATLLESHISPTDTLFADDFATAPGNLPDLIVFKIASPTTSIDGLIPRLADNIVTVAKGNGLDANLVSTSLNGCLGGELMRGFQETYLNSAHGSFGQVMVTEHGGKLYWIEWDASDANSQRDILAEILKTWKWIY